MSYVIKTLPDARARRPNMNCYCTNKNVLTHANSRGSTSLRSGSVHGPQQCLRALSPSPGSAFCCAGSILRQALPHAGKMATSRSRLTDFMVLISAEKRNTFLLWVPAKVPGLTLIGSDWLFAHPWANIWCQEGVILWLAKHIFMSILGAEDGVGTTQTLWTASRRCVVSQGKVWVLLL